VCLNPRWSQYALPMKELSPEADPRTVAIDAIKEDCPDLANGATASALEYLGGYGPSWGTGQDTYYNFHVFEVTIQGMTAVPAGDLGDRRGFLPYPVLMKKPLVSWGTKAIIRALMETQRVAVAIIRRGSLATAEFLMVEKGNPREFCFPLTRIKEDFRPETAVVDAVRADTGYQGKIEAEFATTIERQRPSRRWNRQRTYEYCLCKTVLPDIDLFDPSNAMEQALRASGTAYRWVTQDQMAQFATYNLSSTVEMLRLEIARICNL